MSTPQSAASERIELTDAERLSLRDRALWSQSAPLFATVEHIIAVRMAQALREAADAWDEEDPHRLSTMALRRYNAGGPSMPAIWLRDRAEQLSRPGMPGEAS